MGKDKRPPTALAIYIGTSGWSYPHWKENFYPPGIKVNGWLNYYASIFSTVEINTTFYHLPQKATVQKWNHQVPQDFIFSIKASRYITHRKRLKGCQENVDLLYRVIDDLSPKIGPVLFQLPPTLKIDKERLEEFIHYLNQDYLHVFEFRHSSWYTDAIYEILAKSQIALCISDLNGNLTPEEMTSFFTYIRLHGPHKAYQGSYGTVQLKKWKEKIEKWAHEFSVYCYFDNDAKGAAITDAKTMCDFFQNKV